MKIENIVCSGSFNQELNLRKLSEDCTYIEYGKNKYPGAYIKFDGHSITIYHTGKYIMPGMKSFEDLQKTFERMKKILTPYIDVSIIESPSIRNMVCSSNLSKSLNLNLLLIELINQDMDAVYEPEAFPGLILKTDECTFNVFSGGKFLILGCTSELQAKQNEESFIRLIEEIESRN
ncbi:MAG: hypothetical protein ACI4CE_06045 [Methanomethylophilus alvi]